MKICWDNLEKLKYGKKTGKWYDSHWHEYFYKESCKICNEPFLGTKNSTVCCRKCSDKNRSNILKGRTLPEEHKRNISKGIEGKNNPVWKGGYHIKGIPRYDNYAPQIEWCEEVRRNKEDENILEVKCVYCGKWYIPTIKNVRNRIYHINNNIGSKELRFYCSNGCKKACPVFGRSAETLMNQDAFNAGRLSWLELNKEVQPELRKMVLEKDGYQCIKCGSDGPLHCHHIYPELIEPLLSADIDNCITLCVDCHTKSHQKDGCRLNQIHIKEC